MADLTSNAYLLKRFPTLMRQEEWGVDTSAARTIYQGQPMIIDQDVDQAHLVPFDSTVTLASGDIFVGFAAHGATIAAGAVEGGPDASIEVITGGEIGFQTSVLTSGDLGKTVYMSDSGTFTLTSTGNLPVGILRRVIDGVAYIEVGNAGSPLVVA